METAIETNEEISLLAVLSLFSRRYNPRSLFLLPLDNMFRRGIIAIVEWPVVDYFIMFVIFANVVTMALEDPLVPGESAKNRTLDIFSIVFIVIFTLEAALKVVAYGFFLGPYAYLKDPWNCIDFFIVVTGLFDVLDAAQSGVQGNRVFASFRLLRPLRIIRAIGRFEELRVLVALILSCAAQMINVLGLVCVLLLTFGITGYQIWQGSLRGRCFHIVHGDIVANAEEQICSQTANGGLGKCLPDYQCLQLGNNPFPGVVHFDNVYMSIISTFLVLTAQGWGELMWDVESGFSGASNPIFIFLIFAGHLFLLKLIMVVIANKYASVKFAKSSELSSLSLFELRVGIIEAQELPRMDVFGMSDAYIHMQLDNKTKKSKVLKNTLHPKWYEHHVLPVEKITSLLTLKMYDWNRIGAHDFIGQVVIPVGNCDEHPMGSDRWYEMAEEDTGAACGIIRVQLQWRKNSKSAWSPLPKVELDIEVEDEDFEDRHAIWRTLNAIATSQTLSFVMILIVVLNVMVMGAEHECGDTSYCLDFRYTTEVLNVVFAIMFAIEMLIKIVGIGLVNYCKDSGNMVYVFVVAAGVTEIPFTMMELSCLDRNRGTLSDPYACETSQLGMVRLFRLVRLLRIGRLIEFFPQLNEQLTVMARTVKAVGSLMVLISIVIVIFAILGQNLFAGKSMEAIDSVNFEGYSNFARGSMVRIMLPDSLRDSTWEATLLTGRMLEADTTRTPHRFLVQQYGTNAQFWAFLRYGVAGDSGFSELSTTIDVPSIVGLVPRSNFDNFGNSIITTFQILTLANWNKVWYSCTSSPENATPFVYFFCVIVIGNYVFFNLFAAIIIQGFAEQRQEMDQQLKEERTREREMEEAGFIRVGSFGRTSSAGSGKKSAQGESEAKGFSLLRAFLCCACWSMRSKKVTPEGTGQGTATMQGSVGSFSNRPAQSESAFLQRICTIFALSDCILLVLFQGQLITKDAALENRTVRISSTVFVGLGALDLVRRCLKRQSLKDSFNIMDAVVLLASLPELLFLWTNGQLMAGAEPAFLFLRALRPLRVVLLLENLRDFVGQIKGSAKPLLNTFLIVFFCFIVMGILGVTQLAGKMNFCTDSLIHSKSQCVGMTDAGEVREWKKPALNYDWIGQGTVTMFAIATRDRWTELMYQAVDTNGSRVEGPYRDANPAFILLYFAALFVGGFFLLNFFAGVVVDTHSMSLRKRKSKALHMIKENKDRSAKSPGSGQQSKLLKIVKSFELDIFMLCMIMLDIISMSCTSYKASSGMTAFVSSANFFFTFLYAAEAQVKIYAMKSANYFSNPWHRFEFVILLLSVWGICLEGADTLDNSWFDGGSFVRAPAYFRLFRAVRVLRAFRLLNLQAVKSLQELLYSLSNAAQHISEVFIALFVVYMIFGNLIVGIFGEMCDASQQVSDPFTSPGSTPGLVPRCLLVDEKTMPDGVVVSNVGRAVVTLLSMNTADTWSRVMNYLSLSPGVRKSGENAVPQARIQLLQYLQTREIGYLHEARALLPGCQTADELEALSDVVDCSSKASEACRSTCGNMTGAILLCIVFFCLTTLIILNLLLAVLMQSLQEYQEQVSKQNRKQDGGNVNLLMNVSKAASGWLQAQALRGDDDAEDEAPMFVGVSPLAMVHQRVAESDRALSTRASPSISSPLGSFMQRSPLRRFGSDVSGESHPSGIESSGRGEDRPASSEVLDSPINQRATQPLEADGGETTPEPRPE